MVLKRIFRGLPKSQHDSHASIPKINLLSLPAATGPPVEIRNRIYFFRLEPSGTAISIDNSLLPPLLIRKSRRNFLGLSRVCRLLRNEFRPLEMKHTTLHVRLHEVASFIETFLNAPRRSGLNSDPTVRLMIECVDPKKKYPKRQTHAKFDVLQLVRLHKAHPSFQYRFACSGLPIAENNLNRLFV
ncbi:hypothetical protein BDV96DRAFT_630560 [Lophiotrema nucula]|uniref:F-box domain-containing protein n=1 Tax=Lophiotrema nucula TaxID=690887 RepID=A0A6A5ZDA9_9PLEO|nr:hypothetical protein BDV96DRAFT_630560 [Lophiotrema nucula]